MDVKAVPKEYQWVWWACFRIKRNKAHKDYPPLADCYICAEQTTEEVMWNNGLLR